MLSSTTTANAADVVLPIRGSDAATTASSAFRRHLGLVPQVSTSCLILLLFYDTAKIADC